VSLLAPGVLAVLGLDLLVLAVLASALPTAVRAAVRWEFPAATPRQLALEKRAELAAGAVSFALAFKLPALGLVLAAFDALAARVPGAMCAVGVLQAAPHGWLGLGLRVINVLLLGLWWSAHRRDLASAGWDHSQRKFGLFLVLFGGLVLEAAASLASFGGLATDRIVSCCGTLFDTAAAGFGALLAGLPAEPLLAGLGGLLGLMAAAAWRRWPAVFGLASLAFLPLALVALVAVFSPYVYELPHHRCPFCLLQLEYGGIGYLLYGLLLYACGRGLAAAFTRRVLGEPSPGSLWWPWAAAAGFVLLAACYPVVYRLRSGCWL
jgi:hypothetical protein